MSTQKRSKAPAELDLTPVAGSLEWWRARSRCDPLAAVLDPSEGAEAKNRHIDRMHRAALRRSLGSEPIARVIDFGCGTGRLSRELARVAREVVGVDISEEMLVRARAEVGSPGVHFVAYDGKRLPFEDEHFDAAVSALVLQMYCDDPDRVGDLVRELARVVRREGRLLLMERVAQEDGPRGWTLERWRSELRRCGFEVRSAEAVRRGVPSPVFRVVLQGLVPERLHPAAASLDVALTRRRGIGRPYTECLMRVIRV